MILPCVRCRVYVFLPLTGNEYQEEESVDVSGEVCVEETCHSLHGGSGTTCSLGDFCAISKVIILADNLTCRYRVQICLHSENQNETVCLLSYLSLYFQDYTVE